MLQRDQLGKAVSLLRHRVRGVGDEVRLCALAAGHGVTGRGGGRHLYWPHSSDVTSDNERGLTNQRPVSRSRDLSRPIRGPCFVHPIWDTVTECVMSARWDSTHREGPLHSGDTSEWSDHPHPSLDTAGQPAPQIFVRDFRGKQTATRNCTKLGRCFVTKTGTDDILMCHSYICSQWGLGNVFSRVSIQCVGLPGLHWSDHRNVVRCGHSVLTGLVQDGRSFCWLFETYERFNWIFATLSPGWRLLTSNTITSLWTTDYQLHCRMDKCWKYDFYDLQPFLNYTLLNFEDKDLDW